VVAIFGTKDDNGLRVFRVKDSNSDKEETIPISRLTYQEQIIKTHRNRLQSIPQSIPFIASGYTIELVPKKEI
jgi:hypothetical protein